jgi:hypothetical protein
MRLRVHYLLVLFTVLQGRLECQANASLASLPGDTAALIGVGREIEELQDVREPLPAGSPQQWRILALHQQIYEHLMTASLQVDATTAAIDNEIARSTEVRGLLADKRDRNVSRANLLSALVGGGLGGTSAGLQLSSKQTNAAVATGIAGGAISAGLAFYVSVHSVAGAGRWTRIRTCWPGFSTARNRPPAVIPRWSGSF